MSGSTARASAVVPHMRHGSTAPRQIRTSSNLRKARETAAVLRLDKSTTRQHIKYDSYATRLSYILLLHRFGLKSQEQQASPQKPRSERTTKKKRDLGKNLGPWQEEVVGNDPTDRNPRRVAGDRDPARTSGAVLEQERETWGGRRVNGYGELELPCPSHNPHAHSMAR